MSLGVTSVEGDHIGSDVRTVSLNAVDMYEDPILATGTFDAAGKKVGYLAYSGFDLKSSPGASGRVSGVQVRGR